MTRDDWKRIKDIAAAALDLPEQERADYVARRCGPDAALWREVSSLVDAAARAEGLYETPSVLIAGAAEALESLIQFEAPRVGDRVGPYRLVRSLGGGGMGIAYLAVRDDAEYEKRVAIKLLRRGMDSEAVLRRFRRERQILADLDHPNIARLLDGGTTSHGLPYFVMEYVDGVPIDYYCRSRRLTTRERVILFRRVFEAVDYAHLQQVVHRDLKPANILVTADGTPKLLDFGISTLLMPHADDRGEPTLATQAMSPPYASPEQLRGGPITPASDVYSLGVLLYEMLAERRPYTLDGRTLREIDEVVCERQPAPPSAVAPAAARAAIAGDLDDIVLMALRKEPHRRYASAAALSEDVRHHLEGLPVVARTGKLGYRAVRAFKRHRLRFVEAALVVAMIGAAAVTGPWWSAASTAAPAAPVSVAVLPFRIAASDRDVGYVAEGLAAGLGDSVAAIPGAHVVAPEAAMPPWAGRDLRAIARDLGVASLLIGELSQSGGRVSMDLRLVDGSTGQRLWTRRYDGRLSGLVTLRDGITRDVLDHLSSGAAGGRFAARETSDPLAYELYLKGRYVWNKRTEDGFRRGVDYFREAIARDPRYARAYAGLADCYNLLGIWGVLPPDEAMPQVEDAASRAIALDGTLADAHASLAFVQWVYRRDWDAAGAGFQRALALDPGYATAHTWYAYYLASLRRFDEAVVAVQRARALDPISLSIGTDVGEIYYWGGRDDAARTALESVLQVEPDFAMARNILGLVLLREGRVDEAVQQLEAAHRLGGGARTLSTLAYAYGVAGMDAKADESIAALQALARERYTSAFALAIAHLGSGRLEAALDDLERALDERSDAMVILGAYPLLDPLRRHPRFEALMRRVGLSRAGSD